MPRACALFDLIDPQFVLFHSVQLCPSSQDFLKLDDRLLTTGRSSYPVITLISFVYKFVVFSRPTTPFLLFDNLEAVIAAKLHRRMLKCGILHQIPSPETPSTLICLHPNIAFKGLIC